MKKKKTLPDVLINERDRLGSLADGIGAGMVVIDSDCDVLWMNDRLMTWLNIDTPPPDPLCFKVFYNRDAPCEICAMRESIDAGAVTQKRASSLFANQPWRNFLITCVPVHDEKGEISYVIELVQEVTEAHISREKEQFWQQFFMNVIQNAPAGIVTIDSSGSVFSWNKYMADTYGIPESTILGANLFDRFPMLRDEGFDRKVADVIASRQPMFLFDYRHGGGSKRAVIFDMTIYPLMDESREVLGVSFIVNDTTERNRMQRELDQARDFLSRIFHTVTDFVFIVDFDGRIIDINPATESVFKHDKKGIAGKSLSSFFKHPEEYRTFMQDMMKREKLENREHEMIDSEGESHKAIISASLMSAPGIAPDVIAIIGKDVTDLMQIHERFMRSQRLNALGELASGVAHDFNNILAVILGRAQMMLKQTDDPKLLKNVEIIERAAKHGSESIKRIQSFAKRQAEKELFVRLDIDEVIREAIEFTKPKWKNDARTRGCVIDLFFAPSGGTHAYGNYHELLEVFTNLILNAADAMHGGGELNITTAVEDDTVSIVFSDTGVGMTQDIRTRIFDPFFTTKGVKGTGLGLSVSYGIIERHGGTMEVLSEAGQGATFIVRIPNKPKASLSISETGEKYRVLVVEDDVDLLELIVEILDMRGFDVTPCVSGSDAIATLGRKAFDFVLSDYEMPPGPNGLVVVSEAKKKLPDVRTAIITAWASTISKDEVKKHGVDAVVPKPFNESDIINVISPAAARDE